MCYKVDINLLHQKQSSWPSLQEKMIIYLEVMVKLLGMIKLNMLKESVWQWIHWIDVDVQVCLNLYDEKKEYSIIFFFFYS